MVARKCYLCRLTGPVGRKLFGFDPNDRMWEMSDAWDKAHSNKYEILEREADREALTQAFDLHASDPEASFRMSLDLAGRGSVWSMFEVASSYWDGRGVEADRDKAETWSRRVLEGGDQRAMLQCARMAMWRDDLAAAEAVLQPGVDQKWAPALFCLAWCRHRKASGRKAYRSIRPLLEAAALQGHPAAPVILGRLMAKGKFGVLQIPTGWKYLYRFGPASIAAAH